MPSFKGALGEADAAAGVYSLRVCKLYRQEPATLTQPKTENTQ